MQRIKHILVGYGRKRMLRRVCGVTKMYRLMNRRIREIMKVKVETCLRKCGNSG